jgi:hemoglobin
MEGGNAMSRARSFIRAATIGGLAVALLGAGALHAGEAQPPKSLYDRLGGVYPISVVVDTFIELLLVNDVLNANPAIKAAREQVPAPALKFQVTTLICQQTGGPCKYTGLGMKESHAHLNIGEKEGQVLADFRRVLNNYGVPATEQHELVALVESTKKDIVVRN